MRQIDLTDLDIAPSIKEDVIRLYVTVDDALTVKMSKPFARL